MKSKRHSPEQIVAKLREADAMVAARATIGQICQKLEIGEATFHRWREQYGGMKASEAKRLKELEMENARLKKLVADLALDNAMLKELARGNFCARHAGGVCGTVLERQQP
jgi:transposase-like protein